MAASELSLQHWPIERLIDYARNPRKNDHAVEQMAAVITEFGFRIPVVAKSTGELVDGHLRLKAARKLGLATVPVVLADELTDAQIKAFRLLANRFGGSRGERSFFLCETQVFPYVIARSIRGDTCVCPEKLGPKPPEEPSRLTGR